MLHEKISVFEKRTSDTLLQTEEKIMQSSQELTEHKTKRLAARSEMIGLAQVWVPPSLLVLCAGLQEIIQFGVINSPTSNIFTILTLLTGNGKSSTRV